MTYYRRPPPWFYSGQEPPKLYGQGKIAARKERGAYDSGERAKNALAKCFPDGIPSRADVTDSELVRRVQKKHDELYRSATAPIRKTILIHAGRKNPN